MVPGLLLLKGDSLQAGELFDRHHVTDDERGRRLDCCVSRHASDAIEGAGDAALRGQRGVADDGCRAGAADRASEDSRHLLQLAQSHQHDESVR